MNSLTINYAIEITFYIKGYKQYAFGKDKNLYNIRTNRRIKQSYNNRCLGYWLGKDFYSLKKLRGMLVKPDRLPF